MEQSPLQPDAIRPAKGETVILSNYPKKRYTCACTFEHEWFAEVDEAPDVIARRNPETGKTEIFPRRCKGGRPWQLDRSYVDPNFTNPTRPNPLSRRTSNNWDGYPKLDAADA